MIPFPILGFTFSSIKVVDSLKMYSIKTIYFGILSLYILINYKIFSNVGGFPYSNGLNLAIISSIIFIIFAIFPISIIINEKLTLTIRKLLYFTNGIYVLHSIVPHYLRSFNKRYLHFKPFDFIVKRNLLGCLIL